MVSTSCWVRAQHVALTSVRPSDGHCHGPDGAGSSYAPSLVDSAKHMAQDEFNEIVVNGRTNVNAASENVMPPFGEVEDVVMYLDDIWAYLKARADGVLGRGRPPRVGD